MNTLRPCLDRNGNVYDGYFVSNDGIVYSTRLLGRPQEMKGTVNKYGYLVYSIHPASGKRRQESGHQLVARSWVGLAPTPEHCIDHLNMDKQDNRACNLEWVTPGENTRRSNALLNHSVGEQNNNAVLTPDQVFEIQRLYASGTTTIELSAMFGIDRNYCYKIINKRMWKHLFEEPKAA